MFSSENMPTDLSFDTERNTPLPNPFGFLPLVFSLRAFLFLVIDWFISVSHQENNTMEERKDNSL